MDIQEIFAHNQRWAQEKLSLDHQYFERLAEGQNPEVLYIGCSDSRVTAEEVMGARPGDLFVHRNIANLLPNNDINSLCVINYAVSHLKVKHIVICGHYGCGGVMAAMQSKDLGILNPWLRNIRDVYRLHKSELTDIVEEEDRYRRLVELNVREQCVNAMKAADVQLAVYSNRLTIHGWVFDMESGRIVDLNLNFKKIIEEIREVYCLNLGAGVSTS
jgi:carbonic anhydrase